MNIQNEVFTASSQDTKILPFRSRRLVALTQSASGEWVECPHQNAWVEAQVNTLPLLREMAPIFLRDRKSIEKGKLLPSDFEHWKEFGEGFYAVYRAASGYLMDSFGPPLVRDVFVALAPYRFWAYEDYSAGRFYDRLPQMFTVYRGGVGDIRSVAQGLSWTTSERIAKYYATNGGARNYVNGACIQKECFSLLLF